MTLPTPMMKKGKKMKNGKKTKEIGTKNFRKTL
jgi:hypothetical protein